MNNIYIQNAINTQRNADSVKLITEAENLLRVDVFNMQNKLINSTRSVRSKYYLETPAGEILFDANNFLRNIVKVSSGKYKYKIHLYKPLLPNDSRKYFNIASVSPSRTEITVDSIYATDLELFDELNSVYTLKTNNTKVNYKLPFKLFIYSIRGTTDVEEYDIVDSAITFANNNTSLLLKLATPLSEEVTRIMQVYIVLSLGNEIFETVSLYKPKQAFFINELLPANYNLNLKTNNAYTGYKNYNSLISSDSEFVDSLINEYTYDSVILNVDYSDYANFVLYSSAAARLDNFKYKLDQIALYSSSLAVIQTNITTPAVSSSYYLNNVLQYNTKINSILTGFDQYEKYLYYNSASNAWPKSNSTKPYINRTTTDSLAVSWYATQSNSASNYDNNNQSILTNTLPAHIVQNEFNSNYLTFVNLIGHQLDEIWLYIKQLSNLKNRDESANIGIAKSLIFDVLQSYGWDGIDTDQFDDLWYSAFGTDSNLNSIITGSMSTQNWISVSSGSITGADISAEIWKRILNNLPHLNKTKGTVEGVRSLINCYGIPSTELQIREFGGIDSTINTSEYIYNKFNYALQLQSGSYINIPNVISGSSYPSSSIEFRFKPYINNSTLLYASASNASASFTIIVDSTGSIILNNNTANYMLHNVNVVDNNWWHLSLASNGINNNIVNSTLSSKINDICTIYSASLTTDSIRTLFTSSILNFQLGSNISCSVQDFRQWGVTLNESLIRTHCLSPTSFAGNTISSSYIDLLYRLPLGADIITYNHTLTASLSSSHPNVTITRPTSSTVNVGSNQYYGIEEINYLYWPDTGNNRLISNNVRLAQSLSDNVQLNNELTIYSASLSNYGASNNKIGVYFSPTAEIDKNIVESFGNFKIDDYIGDWSYEYSSSYNLEGLQNIYYSQLNGNYNLTEYTRLLKFYNRQLFDQLKLIIPARAKLLTGLTIEPSVLSRSKVRSHMKPTFESANYDLFVNTTSSLALSDNVTEYDIEITCSNGSQIPPSSTGLAFINGVEYIYTSTIDNVMPYYEGDINLNFVDGLPTARQNLLYNGCKISSPDYNESSPDMFDGSPAVELIITTRRIMTTQVPNDNGNLNVS